MDLALNAQTVGVLLSVVIPIVTGLLTRITTSSKVKQVLTIVFNAVTAVITTGITTNGDVYLNQATLVNFVIGLVISLALYAGIYKPNGFTSSEADGKLAPNKGLL